MKSFDDGKWMRKALRLAKNGMGTTSPNPMVGAVIVRDGKLIGEGWHVRPGEGHAEVNALKSVSGSSRGATLYVTLEPCCTTGRTPPCTDAILRAGIARVVVGCTDPNPRHAGRGLQLLREQGIEVQCGVEQAACELLNETFFKWIRTGRPFVLLKMAQTLDGRIATAGGQSQWITGAEARHRVQKLRLRADAILAGAETFRLDHPRFTARDDSGAVIRTPRRLIATHHPEKLDLPEGWEAVNLDTPAAWDAFLVRMGRENVTTLLLEGGGELAASALNARAVDKIEFHVAPKILGGKNSRASVGGPDPVSLNEAVGLDRVKWTEAGTDWILTAYPVYPDVKEQKPCSQD